MRPRLVNTSGQALVETVLTLGLVVGMFVALSQLFLVGMVHLMAVHAVGRSARALAIGETRQPQIGRWLLARSLTQQIVPAPRFAVDGRLVKAQRAVQLVPGGIPWSATVASWHVEMAYLQRVLAPHWFPIRWINTPGIGTTGYVPGWVRGISLEAPHPGFRFRSYPGAPPDFHDRTTPVGLDPSIP